MGLYHQCKETFERTNVLCLTYEFLGYTCLFLIMFCNCWLLRFLVLFLCQEWISSAGWCFAWCCRRYFRFVSPASFIISCYYIIYFEIHGWYCVGIAIWSFCLLLSWSPFCVCSDCNCELKSELCASDLWACSVSSCF